MVSFAYVSSWEGRGGSKPRRL